MVGLSLAALLVFPVYFLTSFAYSGLATIAAAALAAILFLPACLILLGERVNAWDLRAPLFCSDARTDPGAAGAQLVVPDGRLG